MAKYQAVYKCSLCGKLLGCGSSEEAPRDSLPELVAKFRRLQQFANNPYLDIPQENIPCNCSDGSCGVAYFAGFKRADEKAGGLL